MKKPCGIMALVLISGGVLAPLASHAQPVSDETWNQWRGPERTGMLPNKAWPDQVDENTVARTWRLQLGPSYSGPVLDDQRVYVTETRDKKSEIVRALDRKTGEQLWETEWRGAMRVPFFANANGSWIRATPVLDGDLLYVGGMVDVLVCLEASNGAERWRIDFPTQQGTAKPDFGFASSPMIHGDAIYVQAGGAFRKIDKNTGQEIWKALDDGGGMYGSAFSSPVVATIHGVEQLVVQTRTRLAGVDPQTGNVLWSAEIPAFRGMNILTPLVIGNSIFTSSYRNKSWRLDVERNGDQWDVQQVWETPKAAYMSSPVYHDGHIYLHLGNQRFTCIDFENGEVRWTSRPFGKYSSLILAGDRILALDQRGELLLVEASPEEFRLLSQYRVSDEETWAHLAAAGDQLFVRELNAVSAWQLKPPAPQPEK